MRIHYSQCWEDPRIITQALEVRPGDDVISIASAGDNTFALLLNHPKSITAVDRNEAQIFLVELKIRAIQRLDYDDFVAFLGAPPCQKRGHLYSYLRNALTETARAYWDRHLEHIHQGIIHCGKFEHYFSIFRRMVLPLIHTNKNVRELLEASSLERQRMIYEEIWDNRRWQWLFRIFFGKLLLGQLGRDPSLFRNVKLNNISEELLKHTRRGLAEIPIQDNFFVEYILTGQYKDLNFGPPYLWKSNFPFLKDHVGKIQLVCSTLEEYLKTLQVGTISKFNLSDIFEYMSDDVFEMTLREILRVSRNGSKLAFWTLFVPRIPPGIFMDKMTLCTSLSDRREAADRTFFYSGFYPWNIDESISN